MIPRRLLAFLFLVSFCSARLHAQQAIPLDAATISRLGLVFMPVTAPDDTEGARFPARVTASPQTPAELHAIHGGILEAWHAQPGDSITAGDVLATVRSASALALQRQWVEAQATEQQVAYELERDRALHEQGIIAEQRLRETERRTREASFALRAAEAALAQTGYSADELEALREDGAELGRYRVRAPFSGTLGHINHATGSMLAEGDALLAMREESLWVTAELPTMLAARVEPGQTLRLADTGAELVLRVKEKAIDADTQTLGIQAEFVAAPEFVPGQIVTLLLPPLAAGIAVPADAVVRNGSDTIVYVRTDSGVEARNVMLQALGANYFATDGLHDGDELVVRGASLLKGITLGLGGE